MAHSILWPVAQLKGAQFYNHKVEGPSHVTIWGEKENRTKRKSFFIDKKIAENNHQLIASEKNFPNVYIF